MLKTSVTAFIPVLLFSLSARAAEGQFYSKSDITSPVEWHLDNIQGMEINGTDGKGGTTPKRWFMINRNDWEGEVKPILWNALGEETIVRGDRVQIPEVNIPKVAYPFKQKEFLLHLKEIARSKFDASAKMRREDILAQTEEAKVRYFQEGRLSHGFMVDEYFPGRYPASSVIRLSPGKNKIVSFQQSLGDSLLMTHDMRFSKGSTPRQFSMRFLTPVGRLIAEQPKRKIQAGSIAMLQVTAREFVNGKGTAMYPSGQLARCAGIISRLVAAASR